MTLAAHFFEAGNEGTGNSRISQLRSALNRLPRLFRFCGFEKSEEGIPDLESSEALTVLEILGKKQIAPRLDRG